MTVFDPGALGTMVGDVHRPEFVAAFAQRYRDLLPMRVERLQRAVMACDLIAAMDATLSLKVSSTTVGACELAELALLIEADVRRSDAPAARARAGLLAPAASRADEALGRYLAASAGAIR